ncbi:unnamed protein product [Spirodela intermedia]|uniref:Uncharacterized protein n=1 Tax=Spirodela intermedia TaxID=51605 RepID=A0A7I8JCX9_SPIIN|nr:unnamed protein product [Spirodela intermedia]CAA6668018.1 unnamed protein product [Spirodela intermedia]
MASYRMRLSYQKLRKGRAELEGGLEEEDEEERRAAAASRRSGGWLRLGWRRRRKGSRRWRRLRILRLLRRKAGLVRASLRRVVRRFKEGSSQFGDLFAGNYLFVQVTPALCVTPAKVLPAALPWATGTEPQRAQNPPGTTSPFRSPPPL